MSARQARPAMSLRGGFRVRDDIILKACLDSRIGSGPDDEGLKLGDGIAPSSRFASAGDHLCRDPSQFFVQLRIGSVHLRRARVAPPAAIMASLHRTGNFHDKGIIGISGMQSEVVDGRIISYGAMGEVRQLVRPSRCCCSKSLKFVDGRFS